jgi:putative nucleotidyltransferase with HDIG domain
VSKFAAPGFVMTAIALVQKVKNLPPVSQTALKLLSLLDKASGDNDEIVQLITYDNVLTAKLLRACNSPTFALREPVSSVDQAVLFLGHKQILHIVMTLSFGGVMTVPSVAYTMEVNDLWEHSLVSAAASEAVLNNVSLFESNANVAFTAALLHDIGKLALAQALSAEELAEIRDRIERKQISGSDAEKEVLGGPDHGEVGAALLRSWRLPESILEAVGYHHRPALKPEPRLSALAHIANAVAHHAHPPPVQTADDLRMAESVVKEFNLNQEKLDAMVAETKRTFETISGFVGAA